MLRTCAVHHHKNCWRRGRAFDPFPNRQLGWMKRKRRRRIPAMVSVFQNYQKNKIHTRTLLTDRGKEMSAVVSFEKWTWCTWAKTGKYLNFLIITSWTIQFLLFFLLFHFDSRGWSEVTWEIQFRNEIENLKGNSPQRKLHKWRDVDYAIPNHVQSFEYFWFLEKKWVAKGESASGIKTFIIRLFLDMWCYFKLSVMVSLTSFIIKTHMIKPIKFQQIVGHMARIFFLVAQNRNICFAHQILIVYGRRKRLCANFYDTCGTSV